MPPPPFSIIILLPLPLPLLSNPTPRPPDRLLRMQQTIHNPPTPIPPPFPLIPPLPLMLLPLPFREIRGHGPSDGATDGSQSAAAVFVAYETAARGAEEGGAEIAGARPRPRAGFRAVGTARVAAAAVAVAAFAVIVGGEVALVAAGGGGADVVAGGGRLVGGEGLVGGVGWLRGIAGLSQLTIALEIWIVSLKMRQMIRSRGK